MENRKYMGNLTDCGETGSGSRTAEQDGAGRELSETLVIRELDIEEYRGKTCEFVYETPGFYDFDIRENEFALEYKSFEQPVRKSFTDSLISQWLESPCLYGAFRNGCLAGIAEGSMESWNNRFRINNFLIFEEFRRQGIGTLLMQRMLRRAGEEKARMTVLETQSCNVNAIQFYRRCGFEIIGFDLYCYSNQDPQRGEVRIEMGTVQPGLCIHCTDRMNA